MFRNENMMLESKKNGMTVSQIILLIVVLIFSITLHVHNFSNPKTPFLDEYVYTFQANAVMHDGPIQGIRNLVKHYNDSPQLWKFPPPTRMGFIWLSAGAMQVIPHAGQQAVAYLSLGATILSLLLLCVVTIRFFGIWASLYSVLFFAISPVTLILSGRALQDSLVGFLGLLLVYLALEINRRVATRVPLFLQIAFIGLGSLCFFIKGSLLVFYFLWIIWLLYRFFSCKIPLRKIMQFICYIVVGLVLVVLFSFYAAGGFNQLVSIWGHELQLIMVNRFALMHQNGPWYQYIISLFVMSPITVLAIILGTGMVLGCYGYTKDSTAVVNNETLALMFCFMALLITSCLSHNLQNMRYLTIILAPFYILGGIGLKIFYDNFIKKINSAKFTSICLLVLLAVILSSGIQSYKKYELVKNNEMAVRPFMWSISSMLPISTVRDYAASFVGFQGWMQEGNAGKMFDASHPMVAQKSIIAQHPN